MYRFYQFWINSDDEGVEGYLKVYTDLGKEELDDVIADHNQDRSQRVAQKKLAYEVTKIVHGEDRAKSVQKLSETLFGDQDYSNLTAKDFAELKTELKTVTAKADNDLTELLLQAELASSKGEARRFLQSNAIAINGIKITEGKINLSNEDFNDGYLVLRRGKNVNALVELA